MNNIKTSILGYIFNLFGSLFAKIIKGWKISVSLLSVVLIFFSSIIQSFQEKSFMPFITQVGSKILNADNDLYIKANEVLTTTSEISRWTFTKVWTIFLVNIWILLLVIIVIYMIIKMRNSSAIGANLILAILAVGVIEMFFSFYIISQDLENTYSMSETGKQILPFKGVAKFMQALPIITSGIQSDKTDIDSTIQQTLEINEQN